MSISRNRLFVAVLALAISAPAAAVSIAWYEQRAPGNASGEIRIEDLEEGALRIDTPGRRLEYGIVRVDDVAVVILTEPANKASKPGNLVVVATQEGRVARASFPMALPAQANSAGPELAAANAGSERFTTSGMSPETDPAGRTRQLPEIAVSPARSGTVPSADYGALSADTAGNGIRTQDPAYLPAASNPSPGSAGPEELTGIATAPSPRGTDCPVLVLRPGSLRENVGRLVRECGARLGRWHTSSSAEWLVDWKVPAQELLTRNNADGLPGLLRLLEERYRLAGVPDVDRPGVIDFYRLQMDTSPVTATHRRTPS